MKKLIIIIVLAGCLITTAQAQEKPSLKYHEFGIIFSSLNSFGLRYKYGSEKTKLRMSLLALNLASSKTTSGQDSSSLGNTQATYGGGILIGFESKVPLFTSFSLVLGAEAGLSYLYRHNTHSLNSTVENEYNESIVTPGLSFIFGLNYVLKDHLVIGAEINPTVSYSIGNTKNKLPVEFDSKYNQLNFSLSTAGAGLYIAYRFGK